MIGRISASASPASGNINGGDAPSKQSWTTLEQRSPSVPDGVLIGAFGTTIGSAAGGLLGMGAAAVLDRVGIHAARPVIAAGIALGGAAGAVLGYKIGTSQYGTNMNDIPKVTITPANIDEFTSTHPGYLDEITDATGVDSSRSIAAVASGILDKFDANNDGRILRQVNGNPDTGEVVAGKTDGSLFFADADRAGNDNGFAERSEIEHAVETYANSSFEHTNGFLLSQDNPVVNGWEVQLQTVGFVNNDELARLNEKFTPAE